MIIDAHMHLGLMSGYFLPDDHLERVVETMDFLGIDYGIQMNMAGFVNHGTLEVDSSMKHFELSKGRIFYHLIFDPHYGEQSLELIEKNMKSKGFLGIKIHPSIHNLYADDPRYEIVWQFAALHKLPIVSHTWAESSYNPTQKYSTPEHFEKYIQQFPQVTFVMGHGGGRFAGYLAAIKLAKKYPSIILDTSGDVSDFGLLKMQVDEIGAARVVFGSDLNMMDERTVLGRIYDADITLEEKKMILGENACRLFKMPI